MKRNTREILLALCYKNKGEWSKTMADLQAKEYEEEGELPDCEDKYVTLIDNEYPQSIKQGFKPPFVLFYEGNIELLNSLRKKIAIINSRQAEPNQVDYLLDKESSDYVYVLGGETDTDAYIIKEYKNPVIVVCAYSLCQYPYNLRKKIVENGGVIITAMPDNAFMTLNNSHFAYRNLLIASVCDKVLVTSCRNMSSSLMVVNQALSLNKEVCVMPTSIKEEYINNQLLYEGAECAYDKQSFVDFAEKE